MQNLTGREFRRILARLDPDELDLPAATLLELHDVARCQDCGQHHAEVWEAIACDGLSDARRRRIAGHWMRDAERRQALVAS